MRRGHSIRGRVVQGERVRADHLVRDRGPVTGPDGDGPVMHTLFELCNDVSEMRAFYSHVIGLTETVFNAENGWLTYQAGPVQVVFTEPKSSPVAPLTEWSRSPGWDGGTVDASSWVFAVAPKAFDRLLDRLPESIAMQTRTSPDI